MAKRYNYRDSGSGRYITEAEAKKLPRNQWEKEAVKPPKPDDSKKK